MYKLISGNDISKEILSELKDIVNNLTKNGKSITMVDILVGDDEASIVYIENKRKKFNDIGINFSPMTFDKNVSETEILNKITELNNDKNVNAIFVELPLPKQISEDKIINAINPKKDVDAFNSINLGLLFQNKKAFYPCTAEGIVELLKRSNITIEGKNCVVVGRSNIVGKPVAMMLLNENATVTICHSKTANLKDICKTADILIVAIGKGRFIDDTYVKDGAVVIDAGIHRETIDGKKVVYGDVDFDKVAPITSFITPVPGGVGPMTVTMLIKHCIDTTNNE